MSTSASESSRYFVPADPRPTSRPDAEALEELSGIAGQPLELDLVLADAEDVRLGITSGQIYPTGFTFKLEVDLRGALRIEPTDVAPYYMGNRRRRLDDAVLRFGVETAPGQLLLDAQNYLFQASPDDPQLHLVKMVFGSQHLECRYLAPVLPAGAEVRFVCHWPARGVPFTAVPLGADRFREP